MTSLNDDELEIDWTAEAVGPSDNESTISAGSEDGFEEETELEFVSGIKRSREDEKNEVMNGGDDKNVVKKRKA
ncbi:ubiquitin-specific protease, putative [Plasmopara halstedii]|uniref:Ubiquitin-specific protease, putative n=1 Tax=Plasmopara halstedii TaxID=4781 RepID=A0A0P1A4U5_PLAHL|nr:ubiquitin-specific protease, putative [Plasmopara halstedii]CEG35317.1 ubiquitin-specific protease, putative [Plasmopara halstedii]|eukprot:XP_024571686.1 ubiquitin-specific protease, putative [Plasmopara halstedii]